MSCPDCKCKECGKSGIYWRQNKSNFEFYCPHCKKSLYTITKRPTKTFSQNNPTAWITQRP